MIDEQKDVRTAIPVQKNETINVEKEHTMLGNEIQPILPTPPTAEQLPILCIIISKLKVYGVKLVYQYYGLKGEPLSLRSIGLFTYH